MHRHAKAVFRAFFSTVLRILSGNGLDWFPIRHELRSYSRDKLQHDSRASINVAILCLSQGIAFAAIADLPIYYGILCASFAPIVAPFFSHSRHTILGPTNATAFMVFSFFAASHGTLDKDPVSYMPLLICMVGVLSVIGALLKVADLLQYVSRSVLVGYITGAALLILTNQTRHLLGIATPMAEGTVPKTFFAIIEKTIQCADSINWQPVSIGAATLLLYFILQKKAPKLPNFAISLTLSSIIAYALRHNTEAFADLRTFDPLHVNHLKITIPNVNSGDVSALLGIAFAIAFLASLENTVMSKSIASKSGDRPNTNQDMLSLGMTNIATSLVAPMAASGSLTRSALNYESGAMTRFASIFTGLLGLAGFFILLQVPLVENIPKSSLAALVIAIAISLINKKSIRICLRSTRDDAIVIITTLCATLLLPRLDYAIFIGVGVSLCLFLRKASVPHLIEYELTDAGHLLELGEKRKRPIPAISIVHVEGDLFFGAADLFRTQVQRTTADPNLKVIILRLKNARHLDATSVLALEDLIKDTRKKGVHILISGATREVYTILKQSGVLKTLQKGCNRKAGETNLFMYFQPNPNISTRDALIRAQELLGTKQADIKIFYDPNKEPQN
ncbi:SulP family inorganic anion transporter [Verrucomicrobiaceae bacterium N1E253]|uniref:SulP family inorganic anion transporter n=1 Tax=Oceaniferula marina TaxID=2748318 RepID=A0A851GNS5_9BACT|nr:SulP family inorganic anion transporter [Oceaniferula marina]NWK56480.1 SulP family inorganic anion transporter [Oceaniferula marina]